MRRAGGALALVIAAGAALRFATLDAQSLWFDEAVTARLLRMDLGAMLSAIGDSESTPPLYYLLAWLWTHVCGTGEVGLRSLSALLGTATIAVVWALGRRLGGDRAALAAAALVAFNPMLVWFSQEARAYALLALLGALSTLLWLRALQDDGVERRTNARRLLAWGAVASLALATHYYAVFLVAPQALWLVLRTRGLRERATVLALPLLGGAALAPLALSQRANDSAAFIGESALTTRLAQLPKQFLVGYDAPLETLLIAVTTLAALVGVAGLASFLASRATPARERGDAALVSGLTAVALSLAILAAVGGEDHLVTRNVLFALPLALGLAGAGLAAAIGRAPRSATVALAAACLAGAVIAIGVARDPQLQRDDWHAAARALGPIAAPRLIVATPGSALEALRYYLPRLRSATAPAITTAEIDYVALSVRVPGRRPPPPRPAAPTAPAAGFTLRGRTDGDTFTVLRWRAPAPASVPQEPRPGLDGTPGALLRIGPPARR